MIQIIDLQKSYENTTVLKGVTISIEPKAKYGLIGRSGTGKSTLLRCINALETFDSGRIEIDGTDITKLNKKELKYLRRDIGMVFQDFSLLGSLSVYENIALPLKCWRYKNQAIDTRVKELVEVIGLKDKINFYPRELSGGQKQRVAIARALALNPKILLCDEATSALDPKTAQEIVMLLNNINKELGITLITVTHQLSVLKNICDEISILENGKIACQGKTNEIFLKKPEALVNLMGEKELSLPTKGCNIEIYITEENSHTPIISDIAQKTGANFFVLDTNMETFNQKYIGSVVLHTSENDTSKIVTYLNANQYVWHKL